MKKIVFSLLFAVLFINFAVTAHGQNSLGELHTNAVGGFSLRIPSGWETFDIGLKYMAIRGPLDVNITPNINFVDEPFNGSIYDYIDALTASISLIYSDFRILEQTDFSTSSGLQGQRITIQGRMGNIALRQKMYVIQNRAKTNIFIITGTAGAVHGTKYDSLFDDCITTFNWTR